MLRRILATILIVLQLFPQSIFAFEFQPIAALSILVQPLQGSSDILKNERPARFESAFSFFNISECSKLGLCLNNDSAQAGTNVILPVGRMTASLRLANFGANLRALSPSPIGAGRHQLRKSLVEQYGFAVSKSLARFWQSRLLLGINSRYDLHSSLRSSASHALIDNVSNRLTHAITAAVNKNYSYTYNTIDELTGVTGSETSSFGYDKLGNRTTANGISYTTNNLNQYSAVNSVTHTYSPNGNLTSDGTNNYGYDVENRLTSFSKSGTTASYAYDSFNRRISKTVNGTATYFIYDGDDIIEERVFGGALNADYVHGSNIDETLTMTRGGTTYYYFADGLGSIRELTDSAGAVQETYTYSSFGLLSTTPTINNPFTFTGREYDPESGNYFYRAREYNPSIGRFLQRDPIGYMDSMNLYAYVSNVPINMLDPLGLSPDLGKIFKESVKEHFGIGQSTVHAVVAVGAIPISKKDLGVKILGSASKTTNLISAFGYEVFPNAKVGTQILGSNRVFGVLGRVNLIVGGALLANDVVSISNIFYRRLVDAQIQEIIDKMDSEGLNIQCSNQKK